MIGGEGPASSVWMTTGSWVSYAKQLNAFIFQLEHRFYGKSHPTKYVVFIITYDSFIFRKSLMIFM